MDKIEIKITVNDEVVETVTGEWPTGALDLVAEAFAAKYPIPTVKDENDVEQPTMNVWRNLVVQWRKFTTETTAAYKVEQARKAAEDAAKLAVQGMDSQAVIA